MGAEQSALERALRGVSDNESALYADMPDLGISLDGPRDERIRSNVRVNSRMKGLSFVSFERDILKANAVARVVADELGVLLSFEAVPRVKNRDIVKLFWKQRKCMVVKVTQQFDLSPTTNTDTRSDTATAARAENSQSHDVRIGAHNSSDIDGNVDYSSTTDVGALVDNRTIDSSVYAAPCAFYLLFLMLEDMLQGVQALGEVVPQAQPVMDIGSAACESERHSASVVTHRANGGDQAIANASSMSTSTCASADAKSEDNECPICK
jgi:hypothetical protein